jgi:hypothetical protein
VRGTLKRPPSSLRSPLAPSSAEKNSSRPSRRSVRESGRSSIASGRDGALNGHKDRRANETTAVVTGSYVVASPSAGCSTLSLTP